MNVGNLTDDWSRLWLPPERLPLSEWAEKNIFLSPEYSARTGQLVLYGWQRGILDSFTDPTVETTVLMCGTQLIKTLFQQVATAYIIAQAQAPILIVAPKEDDAETFSKERLEPMIRDCPVLAGKFGTKQKDRLNTTLFKRFPGGSLSLVGAGAPGNAARRSICYAFLDEVDKYLKDVGGEGDFVDLVRERTATYGSRRKIILACSPTNKHSSRIGKAYDKSDQRQPWVACHACGHWQVLRWSQVKWNNDLPVEERAATAHYECENESCSAEWNDTQRLAACEKAEWRARKPFAGTAGYWISHLYSPWKTLPEIVARFLAAKDDRITLKSFVNTNLAELWEEEGDTPEWEVLLGRQEDYRYGAEPAISNEEAVVPRRGLFLTAFTDVQEDRLEYEVVAWGRGKESWSVAYGTIRVFENGKALPTSNPAIWLELDKVLARDWKHESGEVMSIVAMGVDTGFRPKPVYEFAMRHTQPAAGASGLKIFAPRTVVPTKGTSRESLKIIAGISKEDAARKRQGVRIVSIGTSVAKQELFDNLRLPRPTGPDVAMPGYCHIPMYGEEFAHGICSEKRIVNDDDSISWEKIYSRNEPLDCRVGNRAMAAVFGIDRFGEKQWAALERQFGQAPVEELKKPETAPYIEPIVVQPPRQPQAGRPQRPRTILSPYL